jgi:hypothetical protein
MRRALRLPRRVEHECGDRAIFVGEVVDLAIDTAAPLVLAMMRLRDPAKRSTTRT